MPPVRPPFPLAAYGDNVGGYIYETIGTSAILHSVTSPGYKAAYNIAISEDYLGC